MTDSITYYRICGAAHLSTAIIPVEIINETKISVTLKVDNGRGGTRRVRKDSSYYTYCNSWEQARKILMERINLKIMRCQNEIQVDRDNLQELLHRKQQ